MASPWSNMNPQDRAKIARVVVRGVRILREVWDSSSAQEDALVAKVMALGNEIDMLPDLD